MDMRMSQIGTCVGAGGVLQHRVSRSREAEPGRDARQGMAARAWLAALFEDIARRTKLEVRGLIMPLS